MTLKKQSDIFKPFLKLWKLFGIWFGKNTNKKRNYYSWLNILINLVFYNILLTVNLYFTPRKIKCFIPEVIFYFTEIAITSKVFMLHIMRDKILEAFNIMDGEDLDGGDEASNKVIERDNANIKIFWKSFNVLAQVAYINLVFVPVILHFATKAELALPISQYYFLTDTFREQYFVYLYIYQSYAVYGHMMYNITIDTFVAGLLLTAVTQLKVLSNKLKNLKVSEEDKMLNWKGQDEIQNIKLRTLLVRYGVILRYCNLVQDIISFNMFVIFGLASIIICVTLCELLFLPTAIGLFCCMIIYLIAMLLQIFMPAYLGTLIDYENAELVFAAYCSEWIPRSKAFKNNLKFFVERAKSPIKITGLKTFIMSLGTFTSIVKMTYSFFALLRNFQE